MKYVYTKYWSPHRPNRPIWSSRTVGIQGSTNPTFKDRTAYDESMPKAQGATSMDFFEEQL